MKILFLSRLFYPHIGGVETHVMEISKRLIKQGHEVTVLTEELEILKEVQDNKTKTRNHTSDPEIVNGIKIYHMHVGKDNWLKKFRIWYSMWKMRQLIKDADIVHCHDVFFWYAPFRFLYQNKPVYTTFHGHEGRFPLSPKTVFIRKFSDDFSFGSINIGDFIQKWYGTHPNYVSYGGVTVSSNKKNQPTNTKPRIIFIGRLEQDTGIVNYLQALEILKKKKVGFTLEAYGDGSLRSDVEKLGTVHGFVKAVYTIIYKADLVLCSSYLSILEAFAAKKLVISTYDNPLKKDYLTMSPFAQWIIIKKEPEKLAERIEYYLTHPKEQKEIIEKSYTWAKEQTWDNVTNLYLKLWKKNRE